MSVDAATVATRWWHYTLATTLLQIIGDEGIRRTSMGVTRRERKAVWFSRRPTWEPTATKALLSSRTGGRREATIDEMLQAGGSLIRIEVPEDIARHTWAEHRQIGQIDPRMADGFEAAAQQRGADPLDWRVSYHDVSIDFIMTIEASKDGTSWNLVGAYDDREATRGLRLMPTFLEEITAATDRLEHLRADATRKD